MALRGIARFDIGEANRVKTEAMTRPRDSIPGIDLGGSG